MEPLDVERLVADALIVLAVGFVAAAVCRRLKTSLLLGYLIAGAFIGDGGLGLVAHEGREMEVLARTGVLLLLFSIGIEFSLDELLRHGRYLVLGGAVQMLAVTLPAGLVAAAALPWRSALLVGLAVALSSTVLVFRALVEHGQSDTALGRRAIGILLFQDIALVPIMLLVPLLTEATSSFPVRAALLLALNASLFVGSVALLRLGVMRFAVPALSRARSLELVILFTLLMLAGLAYAAYRLGLPPLLGAFAAGLIVSGTRLTRQIDALVLPFRETFAAVFFVSLGTVFDARVLLEDPLWLPAVLIGVVALKTVAAAIALRLVGLTWTAAWGMGLGLAQLGEFSFVLLLEGLHHELLDLRDYSRLLFVALGTLLLTPQVLKWGCAWRNARGIGARAAAPMRKVNRRKLFLPSSSAAA